MDRKTREEIREKFKNARKRLVLLDYDGTLVNHTALPDTANLTEEISHSIRRLIHDPKTEIYIITGRDHEDIDKLLNHIPIKIIADHGAVVKEDGQWKNQIKISDIWKKEIIPVMTQLVDICPESYIEEKCFSIAWHYRNSESNLGYQRSRELIMILKKVIDDYNLKILDGNKVVEVLTNETGKGLAVKKLSEGNKFDLIVCIGDDATDEEMFDYFLQDSRAVTIKVGEGVTNARHKLNNINEVASLLKQLSG